MRLIGTDPGYDRLGVAVLDHGPTDQLVFSTCLETPPQQFTVRLRHLGQAFQKIIDRYQPERLAIEKLFFANNQKTASRVSEIRGMIIYLAACSGLTVFEYAPTVIKQTLTGYGHASKKQVAAMVERLVKLPRAKRRDDEYDAIAVALTAGVCRGAAS